MGDPGRARPRESGELTAAETGLRLALDASQMGLWDWDVAGDRLVWDERSAQLYGTTVEESSGSIADVDARVHPEDLERVRSVLSGAIERAGAVDVEFRVVWPDGSTHWLYGRGQAVVGADGTVQRLIGVNADVTAVRSQALEQAADAARMAGLVAVAQALGDALTEAAVLTVVADRGVALLGGHGVVLVLRETGGATVRSLTTSFIRDRAVAEVALLPATLPLPMVDAATTGASWFLRDRAEAEQRFPGAAEIYAGAAVEGSAAVPLLDRGSVFGSLVVGFLQAHAWRPAECSLLEALAALTAQAVVRVRAVEAERVSLEVTRRMSESLQRSLLTEPPVTPGLAVAVRYLPVTMPRAKSTSMMRPQKRLALSHTGPCSVPTRR